MTYSKPHSDAPWQLQELEHCRNGYNDWATFCIRDSHNHCLATVGDIDRATTPNNRNNANLMLKAPDMLVACQKAIQQLQGCAAWLKSSGQGQVALGTLDVANEIKAVIETLT